MTRYKWYCPLLQKDITVGLCWEIYYEPGLVTEELGKSEQEMETACKECPSLKYLMGDS